MSITDKLKDKKILIWGYGREGRSTESFIKDHCPGTVTEIFEGKREDFDIDKYDYVIKSPGIVCFEKDERLTSQTQLFLEEFRHRVIGVTGTKGKSTTASLIYEGLKAAGRDVILAGNIGLPCLDFFDEIKKDTVIIFELSCHQLSTVSISPHIAVLLNLYEEHLDYYGSAEKYFEAKKNIARFQKEGDLVFAGEEVSDIPGPGEKIIVKAGEHRFDLKLPGEHNQFNAMVALKVCENACGEKADTAMIVKGIESFKGLKHRLEYLGNIDGIDYYDDSISTIPEAAICAAESIKNTGTLLIGGMDRGIDYKKLIDFMKKRQDLNYICMYESGHRIFEEGEFDTDNVICVKDLKEAVIKASQLTPKGHACLLSPAAASYGYFKNFEERGDVFASYVRSPEL